MNIQTDTPENGSIDSTAPLFQPWPKMARLSREIIITEKIDGTNAQLFFDADLKMHVGSRTRWLSEKEDNFGFHKWAVEHEDELRLLGPGRHYGEWWGSGIQRGYGLTKGERRFSLFNVSRWCGPELAIPGSGLPPSCCHVVPVLYRGRFDTAAIENQLQNLKGNGSYAAPGFMQPEGIVIFHTAANMAFKKTCVDDEKHKGEK